MFFCVFVGFGLSGGGGEMVGRVQSVFFSHVGEIVLSLFNQQIVENDSAKIGSNDFGLGNYYLVN